MSNYFDDIILFLLSIIELLFTCSLSKHLCCDGGNSFVLLILTNFFVLAASLISLVAGIIDEIKKKKNNSDKKGREIMKLPNDLIKATDYEKAKERVIHEFECVNGKFIQHYVLGGEHELTEEEVVDCLNALVTLDCDLSTAYAYIKGQNEKMKELEEQLSTATTYHGCDTLINELNQEIRQLKYDCAMYKSANHLINEVGIYKAREIMFQSEQKLKQSQNQKVIEVLEDIRKTIRYAKEICGGKATDFDIVAANAYNRCLDDMQKIIDNQIKELEDKNGK